MSVSLSIDGPGDAELISAVRGGDVDAYGELFARHVDAARRLARQLTGPADADDLVSDAFTKVLTVLQRGGGPDLAFRAYLLTAVRRLHVDKIRAGSRLRPVDDLAPFDPGLPFHDTAVEGFDNAAAARAFASLPERWQMVLWHTEVEQQKPADIAPLLGMSANSVSALAYRAREGLRQAFLSQHATDPDDVDCAWTRDHLGAYVRGGLSRRDGSRVDDHLASCRACAAVYLELTEVNSGLAGLLAPLLLGTAGAGYLSSAGGAGSGAMSSGFAAAKTWAVAHASLTAVGGLVVTTAAVVSIYGATHLHGHNAADLGSPPVLDTPAAASTLPTPDSQGPHGTRLNHQPPGVDTVGDTSPASPSTSAATTPPVSGDSSAPPVGPGNPSPSSTPTDPTTGPTDPTTGPTDPTTGPTTPAVDPITFDSSAPVNPALHSTYVVSASGGSGGTIQFSVDPAGTSNYGTPDASCSIVGDTVTFDHAGTCVIDAQEGTGTAALARSLSAGSGVVQQSIVVPQVPQDVAVHPSLETSALVGGQVDLTATGGDSGNPVVISATPNDVCSFVDGTLYFLNPGTCDVTATQGGTVDYAEGSFAATLEVLAPPNGDLKVSAEVTGSDQNKTEIRATVENLPDRSQATVTISPEGSYEVTPDDGTDCQKTGPASYVCTVSSDQPWVDFSVNVHNDETRFIDFAVAPVDPLIDPDPGNNTFRLQLDG